jgi:hypothetical protein
VVIGVGVNGNPREAATTRRIAVIQHMYSEAEEVLEKDVRDFVFLQDHHSH